MDVSSPYNLQTCTSRLKTTPAAALLCWCRWWRLLLVMVPATPLQMLGRCLLGDKALRGSLGQVRRSWAFSTFQHAVLASCLKDNTCQFNRTTYGGGGVCYMDMFAKQQWHCPPGSIQVNLICWLCSVRCPASFAASCPVQVHASHHTDFTTSCCPVGYSWHRASVGPCTCAGMPDHG
jgi:hypothetical protein